MIKAQTAVKGVRQEGGRKEGRRSVSWRDVVGRIRRKRRRRRNTGVACSKQRFGLTENLYMIASTRGRQNWTDTSRRTQVKSAQTTEPQKQFKGTSVCQTSTNLHAFILMHTTRAKADMQLHAHVQLSLAGGSRDSGNEIQFLCSNFFGDETLEDSTVCPVCKRISFFLLLSLFFSAKPVLLTAFLQPSAHSISLSASFLSPFLFFFISLSLPWHSLVCQACNRAAIV